VISHVPGQLELRLELVALLWAHGISADLMYESGIEDGTDAIHELCIKEGILCAVLTRETAFYIRLLIHLV
jgi:translation initiation factor 2-alpha kinase 4